jgi:hypothetical protein
VQVTAWNQMHARLTKDSAWQHHPGKLPVVEGTVIQLRPGRLPGYRDLKPMWLWASDPGAGPGEITTLWQAYLRRFDLETSKPQCCHSRGWPASLWAPSCSVFMRAAWFCSQGRRLCWPRGTWCRARRRSTSARSARTTRSLAWGCR